MTIRADFWNKFGVAGYFLALTLALRLKVVLLFNSAFLGGTQGDAGLYIWLSYLTPKTLLSLPWFSTQAFFPYQNSLAFSDNFILPALMIEGFQALRLSFPASYNLVHLIALFLNGFCTSILVQKRGAPQLAGLFAGTVILSFGFLTAHSGHPQLQFFFWIPLGLLFWLKTLEGTSTIASLKYGFFAGFTAFLTLLCSVYYLIFLLSIFSLTLLFDLFFSTARYALTAHLKQRIKQLIPSGIALTLGLLPSIPFILPYLQIKSVYGERGVHEAFYFSASPLSFLSSPPLTWWGKMSSGWSHAEAWLFPGFACLILLFLLAGSRSPNGRYSVLRLSIPFLLALLAIMARLTFEFSPAPWGLYLQSIVAWAILIFGNILVARSSSSQFQRLISFLALNTAVISLGPLGNPAKDHLVFSPYMIFKAILPGLEGIRAISRMGIVTIFCVGILAGINWIKIIERSHRKLLASTLILFMVVLENRNSDIAVEQLPPKPLAFSHLPNNGKPMITLPLVTSPLKSGEVSSWSDFARQNVNAMLWSMDSNHPTANGYSGLKTSNMLNYPRWLSSFPSDESVKVLNNAGIEFVINLDKDPVDTQDPLPEGLKLIFAGEDGSRLYQISR